MTYKKKEDLSFLTLPVGSLQTNCFIVYDKITKKSCVIDPGSEASLILSKINQLSLNVEFILLTHGHFDHLGGLDEFLQNKNVPVYLHENDLPLFSSLKKQGLLFGVSLEQPLVKPHALNKQHDQCLFLTENHKIKIIETPGHSPGSCSFYFSNEHDHYLFSGDTLFKNSVGRTDLWGGSEKALMHSLRTQLFILPPSTLVLPGHGPTTTIEHEIKNHSFNS